MSGTLQSATLRHQASLMYRRAVLIEKGEFLWKQIQRTPSEAVRRELTLDFEILVAELMEIEECLPNLAKAV